VSWHHAIATVWGVLGVMLIVGEAVVRLAGFARAALAVGLDTLQWVVAALWIVLMAVFEGYRGFHRKFSPRVVARALHLGRAARPIDVVLAPLYCMSLYGASRRGVRAAWLLVVFIVALILLVRLLPQPWRGIIDAGVVAGLGIGLASMTYFSLRALAGKPPAIDPDLAPTSAGSSST
jgi:hypothetical protein